MILNAADWQFRVDKDATWEKTQAYSLDHCTCGYCQNFYDTVQLAYPNLENFLKNFGVYIHGPVEVMPFEPTVVLVCYRVQGQILRWGMGSFHVGGVMITPEAGDDNTFHLWVGEMVIPWVQETPQEEVVSPANLPEFMDRMHNIWLLRHGSSMISS